MLEIKGLEVAYGGLTVLWDIDVEVERGEVVAIIGCNGAGKTTLLKSIVGMLRPQRGQIRFDGVDITCLLYTSPSPRD